MYFISVCLCAVWLQGHRIGVLWGGRVFVFLEAEQDCKLVTDLRLHHCSCLSHLRLFLIIFVLLFQIIQPLLELDQNRSKLKLYIGHLTALCHDRDPLILRGLTPPASYHLDDDRAAWEKELQKMTQEQVSLWSEALSKGLKCLYGS